MNEPLFGRFLELSLTAADIAASAQFYLGLGFSLLNTNDTWAHPYGVLSDGRICLGLHQRQTSAPVLSFVRTQLAAHVPELRAHGIEPHFMHLGDSDFHELEFQDPSGQLVRLLEARTFAPPRGTEAESRCGYFSGYSLPTLDFEHPQVFWERAGFVALPETDEPFVHLPMTCDQLSLSLHRPRLLEEPALLFYAPDMAQRIESLRQRDYVFDDGSLPRGLRNAGNGLMRAPEGTALLLLNAEP